MDVARDVIEEVAGGSKNMKRSNRGMHLVLGVLIIGSLALAFGMVQNQRARTLRDWTARLKADLAARDLVQSALAEATHEMMTQVNQPGTDAFQALRRPGLAEQSYRPRLERCRELLARQTLVKGVEAEVIFRDREAFPGANPQDQEWRGFAVVRVTVTTASGPGFGARVVLEGTEAREVKATSIAPPRPLDRWCNYQAGLPSEELEPSIPAGIPAPEFPLSRQLMEMKASLRIDGDPNEGWRQLSERLGEVNGVVYVDNPGQPLILRGFTHRGKTLLVTRGPVILSDVRRERRETDQLVVMAFGDVSVDGRVEAVLIATQEKGEQPPQRAMREHTRLVGGFVLTSGAMDFADDVGVECDLDFVPSGNPEGPLFVDRIYISISPQLSDSRVVVRS